MSKSQRVLVVAAVLQGSLLAGVLGFRVINSTQSPVGFMEAGDTVVALIPNDDRPAFQLVGSDQTTAVLAFRSTCQWCDSAAPAIARWLAVKPEGLQVVAISPEPYEAARDYVTSQDWDVTVFPIDEDADVSHKQLVGRTPWVFFFGPDGILTHSHHAGALPADDGI